MSKYELILALCQEKGVKITNVEKELGFAKGSFKKMDSSKPSAEKIHAIASYFHVPMEMFFSDNYEEFKDNYLSNRQPLYDVAAGQGRVNGNYSDEYVEAESLDGCSWCRICGDSMYPILLDGDLVKVEHMTQTEPTDLTIIKINGDEATCKYVEVLGDGIVLRAENKEVFEDKFYSVSDVLTMPIAIIGKVVEMKRKF